MQNRFECPDKHILTALGFIHNRQALKGLAHARRAHVYRNAVMQHLICSSHKCRLFFFFSKSETKTAKYGRKSALVLKACCECFHLITHLTVVACCTSG